MFDAQLAPPPPRGGLAVDQPEHPREPRRTLPVRLGAYVGTMIVCLMLALMATLTLGPHPARGPAMVILTVGLIAGSLLGYVSGERWVAGRRPLAELSLRRLSGAAWGLALGAASVAACIGLVVLLGGLRYDGPGHPTPVGIATLLLTAGLQAAVVEEIAYRGILFRYLEVGFGTWGALLGSGIAFGLSHLGNPNSNPVAAATIVVAAGLLFAALYILTRNLWVVMGVHCAWNVTQALLGVQVSGYDFAGLLRLRPSGPTLLSGGAFGVEASIVTLVVMGALATWLLVIAHRRGCFVAPLWVRRRAAAPLPTSAPRV